MDREEAAATLSLLRKVVAQARDDTALQNWGPLSRAGVVVVLLGGCAPANPATMDAGWGGLDRLDGANTDGKVQRDGERDVGGEGLRDGDDAADSARMPFDLGPEDVPDQCRSDGDAATPPGADPSIAPPRQVAPLSSLRSTTQRPLFRWALPPGVPGARIEFCAGCACSTVVASVDTTGQSWRSGIALSHGVHFWRLRGIVDGRVGTRTSPVWSLSVPVRDTPVVSAWGLTRDYNGDGIDDVILGAPGASPHCGRALVLLGSARNFGEEPILEFASPRAWPDDRYGQSVASIGDFSGDGLADRAVLDNHFRDPPVINLYHGAPGLLASEPARRFVQPDPTDDLAGFGATIAGAGDLDGDGLADFVISEPRGIRADGRSGNGRVHLALGRSGSNLLTTDVSPQDRGFGSDLAGGGDFNGDGYADYVASVFGSGDRAVLVLGSSSASEGSITLRPDVALAGFGDGVAWLGDIDGDGLSDVAVGSTGTVQIYRGRRTISGELTPDLSVFAPEPFGWAPLGFGDILTGPADINGDGFADLVLASICTPYMSWCGSGRVYIYYGGRAIHWREPAQTLIPPEAVTDLGVRLLAGPDVNGDGFGDLIVAGRGISPRSSRFHLLVYWGSSLGVSSTPGLILDLAGRLGSWFALEP